MTNCFFTVDLEDWYQLQFYKTHGQIIGVDENFNNALDELLQLLSQRQIKATFFVLGIIAKTNPEVLIRISEQGHEIGSHGMFHISYRNVSDEIWMNDVQESKLLIESVVGKNIVGFRAPFFAAPRNYKKFLEYLSSIGFLYDSSYHVSPLLNISIKEVDYGVSFPLHDIKIMELTPSYLSGLFRIPLFGGSYFRLLSNSALTFLLTNCSDVLMFYMHPYEIYERPLEFLEERTSFFGSLKRKIRLVFNNYNRKNFMKKVRLLTLWEFNFSTIEEFYHEFRKT